MGAVTENPGNIQINIYLDDFICCRWMRSNSKEIVREGGKPVLQFVSIQRSDNKEWAIPGVRGVTYRPYQVYVV